LLNKMWHILIFSASAVHKDTLYILVIYSTEVSYATLTFLQKV